MKLSEISSKLKIIGYGGYGHGKNGALQGLYLPIFGHKEYRIRIVPAQNVVYLYGDETVGQLVPFMVTLYIDAQIQTVVVGYPEGIPIAESHKVRIVEPKGSHRKGHRTPGLIGKVHRNAVPPGKLIVGDDAQVVWLVKIGREKLPIIDALLRGTAIEPIFGTGVGIAEPPIKITSVLPQQEFDTIGFPLALEHLGLHILVQLKVGPRFKVQHILHTLVVSL